LVLVDLPGDDLILCQITTRARSDDSSIALEVPDFERGQLSHPSFIRPQRLFTIEQRVVLYSAGKVQPTKLDEVLAKTRALFT
jgi:mRNA interferase MazF